MRFRIMILVIGCSWFLAPQTFASIFYVNSSNSTPGSPFTTWATAATNIQDAIDVATNGDLILVTNGIYQNGGRVMAGDLTNRVTLNKAVTVQSVNGPWATIIQGTGATNGTAAVRCAWLTNNATLIGFTLEWGATRTTGDTFALQSGGGVFCSSSNAMVFNCVVISNTTSKNGGGVYQGTLNNCLISSNGLPSTAPVGAGTYNSILINCTVVNNRNGIYSGPPGQFPATNCIIYFNAGGNFSGVTFSHCCTTPAPGGDSNFTNNPQFFIDDAHLTSSSPCIGVGISVTTGTDIFGRNWSNPPSVGCSEWQPAPFLTAPQMQLTLQPIGFTIGNSAINGQPPFNFWWIKDNSLLQDNGHFTYTQTTNLIVTGLNFSDRGNYQLVASNSFGISTSSVVQIVIHCVDVSNVNPVAPYLTWVTAATNIQDAIDAANLGEIVLVTNGTYRTGGRVMSGDLTNRVALNKAIIATSVNGYAATIIQGTWDPISTNGPAAIRCAYITNNAAVNGFTLQNGAARASGDAGSGGALESGGGAWCAGTNAIISNCFLTNNTAIYGGGVAYGTLNNSLATYNLASYGAGAYYTTLNNSTVINNYTTTPSFVGKSGGGSYDCPVRNSIVLYNGDNWPYGVPLDNYYYDAYYNSSIKYLYSCTSPLISNGNNIDGTNSDPQFLDLFHISANSPCRGAGSAVYSSGTDLDGETWLTPPSMGCDEVVISNLVGPLSVNLFAYQTNFLVNRNEGFVGTISGRASNVVWSFGDGPTFTNFGAYASHQWTSSGDFIVTLTVYNLDNLDGISTNIIVHVQPLIAPQLQSLALTNGFQFQFVGQTNANYTIQYTTNLVPPIGWQTLRIISFSSGGTIQINDPSLTNVARFYRVWAQ